MAYRQKVTQELVSNLERLLNDEHKSIAEAARTLGISHTTGSSLKKAGFDLSAYRQTYLPQKIAYGIGEPSKLTWFQELYLRFINFLNR